MVTASVKTRRSQRIRDRSVKKLWIC